MAGSSFWARRAHSFKVTIGAILAHLPMFAISDQSGNTPDIVSNEGDVSLRVVPGLNDTFTVNISSLGINAGKALMLIDKSDVTNWPHTNTGHINILHISPVLTPSTAFRGRVILGFLTDVDGDNSNLNVLHSWNFTQSSEFITNQIDWSSGHVEGNIDNWFGPILADNENFQNDENLDGPDGSTEYPSGDGDIVILVERVAGTIDVEFTAVYKAIE